MLRLRVSRCKPQKRQPILIRRIHNNALMSGAFRGGLERRHNNSFVSRTLGTQPERLLLLSLLMVILLYPALDHGDFRRLIMGVLMFVPVLLATFRLAQIKRFVWPSLFLMICILISIVANMVTDHPAVAGIKWGLLTVFFAVTVVGLFSHLRNARSVSNTHLYVAVSIYILLAMQWFSLYQAIEIFYPGSITHANGTARGGELLYFSIVTLTTIGYGDVAPVGEEVRMLAALEGMAGVLYIAITVALLVSAYKRQADR